MDINEIKEILELIQADTIEKFEYFDGNRLYEMHSFVHSPDTISLYKIDLQTRNIQRLIDILNGSLIPFENLLWFCKKNSKWEKNQVTSDEIEDFIMKNDQIYLLIQPQEDSTDTAAFVEMIAHLRSSEGCPWDRKQTHQSLRTNLLEETYEVLEAIDDNDDDHLKEELGDLLLQIVLHAQLAKEDGAFTYENVVHDIFLKIKHRHPHVFEKLELDGVSGVMRNWEKIKEEERNHKGSGVHESILTSIPKELPALSIAQKYQERASRVGFDWEEVSPVFDKILEEIGEVRKADSNKGLEEELGDLLFAVVNLVRWSGFDAENALRLANKKFCRRFQFIENNISESKRLLTDVSLSEMDMLWDEAKQNEH